MNYVNSALCGHMTNVCLMVLATALLVTGHPGAKVCLYFAGASWGFAYVAEQLYDSWHTKLAIASVLSTVAGYVISIVV